MIRTFALVLTVLTGASGLVYQVAWQKVLASLLGSHSEATAAVLALFLGGLSLGYALFGRISRRVVARGQSLFLVYGVVESAIGGFALLFPWLFAGIRALSLAVPQSDPAMSFALDVGFSALLVLPPTILMGGTVPLLTQGLSRNLEDATRLHSAVYGWNTAGAFVGALAGTFVLIPMLGLEQSIRWMGVVNLSAGFCFIALRRSQQPAEAMASERPEPTQAAGGIAVYALVAMLAGFAMMSLQTALNRIGALALGASPFTFGMVVAVFVLCIALGSFVVAALPRIRPSWLAISQWALVGILLALYPHMEDTGFWAHVLHSKVGLSAPVLPYYSAMFVCVLVIALPPLALSGALLPLLFHHLRERADDLGAVAGRLYAWNTAGSLLGALLGGYVLLFWLDLHHVYRLAVAALAVGAALLTPRVGLARGHFAALGLVGVLAAVALQPAWSAERLTMGIFRSRLPVESVATTPNEYFTHPLRPRKLDLLFASDDPSTTVTVGSAPTARAIIVNGKSDGAIPADNQTTGLLALLPAMLAEKCERAFVIGFGTGMTVGELAALDTTTEVVVAEISQGVVQAAPLFETVNRGALTNPKTRLIRSDAYRALLRDDSHYDVIVSEPSNPWVTGVENLYTVEFLGAAQERLAPGGVYAQWFHLYETDDEALRLVLGTFRSVFDGVAVWAGKPSDLVILGFANGDAPYSLAGLEAQFQQPGFNAQLQALPISSFPRLVAHEVLPPGVVHRLELPDRLHTLLHPVLSDIAARAFYRKSEATVPIGLVRAAADVGARNSLGRSLLARESDVETRLEFMREACDLRPRHCATLFALWQYQDPHGSRFLSSLEKARNSTRFGSVLGPGVVEGLARFYGADATAGAAPTYELASELSDLYALYYHHAVPFDPTSLHLVWRRCAESDARCAARLDEILGQGMGPELLTARLQ